MHDKEPLLVLVGPTASGKSAIALRAAERLGGEVISADSVQVYRRFDIGSGKPTAEERRRIPHHLIDIAEPLAPMDAAMWARLADQAVAEVRSRGRVPIVCGGTFLWVRALLLGLAPAPPADEAIRTRHREKVEANGRAALHGELARVDPDSAGRLSPNDFVRVSRALEVHELTGKPMSVWQREHGFREEKMRARLIALAVDPATLTDRITARAREGLASGWIEEVESLVARGYGESRAMSSVGYAQVRAMLAGELPRAELEIAVVRATRIFARRQRTWLNHADVSWI
jgi:tRNA dimethylallyltransferase